MQQKSDKQGFKSRGSAFAIQYPNIGVSLTTTMINMALIYFTMRECYKISFIV